MDTPLVNNMSTVNMSKMGDMHGHHGNHHGDQMDGMEHGMMKMYFHFSTASTILFERWTTSSWQGMVGSCVGIFILGIIYEGLKAARANLLRTRECCSSSIRRKDSPLEECKPMTTTQTSTTSDEEALQGLGDKKKSCRCSPYPHLTPTHNLDSLLYLIQTMLSYGLMLIVMTYNAWLALAVVLGAALGHWLFAARNFRGMEEDQVADHCH